MTIFIDKVQVTHNSALGFISELDDLVRQIVRAWHQSNIRHCFKDKSWFNKAVHRNRKTLKSMARDKIDMLFTSCNYLFSTRAEGRKKTLYFKDKASKRTGRLRQQHPEGPLAKIDKKPRTHRFLSKARFGVVKKWHHENENKRRLPFFYDCETHKEDGRHHLEFSYDGKEVSGWHSSGGTVKTGRQDSKKDIERRIDRALTGILGIGPK